MSTLAERGRGPRVAAIVPAYNEQETLTDVLSVLKSMDAVDEVIVVSDGSTDDTVTIARALGVRTLCLRENHGKGRAMAVGVAHTEAPVLLFVDGDILNLSEYLLDQLVGPVVDGRADMNIGVRHRGWVVDAFHRKTGPLLSGIRCLRREIFEAIPEEFVEGYVIETSLNWACRRLGCRTTTTVLHNLKHRVKEKKRGLVAGACARCDMFRAVFVAWCALLWRRPVLRTRVGALAARDIRAQPELEYINW